MSNSVVFSGSGNLGVQVGQVTGTLNYYGGTTNSGSSEGIIFQAAGLNEARDFLQSLSSNYRQQKDVNPRRVEGTCEWFLGDPRFHQWREAQGSRLLHVYAGPGCGKSVLTRALIDELLVSSGVSPVLYFFFKSGQEGQDESATAVAAMLHQLFQISDKSALVNALPKYRAHGSNLRKMFGELWELMVSVAASHGGVVIVLDALDECALQSRRNLMDAIEEHCSRDPSKSVASLKFLITSRPYRDVMFDAAAESTNIIRFDGAKTSDVVTREINRVIAVKVPSVIPRAPRAVQDAIIVHLQGMQNRTYLWLHLTLDKIKQGIAGQGTERRLKNVISQLPKSVEQAYDDMLKRSLNQELTKILLSIVVGTKRLLSVQEAKIALALAQDDYQRTSEIDLESDEQFEETLNDLCGLLLAIHDAKVHFIHETAREYILKGTDCKESSLLWKHSIPIDLADAVLAEICVSFLSLQDFLAPPPWKDATASGGNFMRKYGEWVDEYVFLDYTASFWLKHCYSGHARLTYRTVKAAKELWNLHSNQFHTWHPVMGARTYTSIRVDQNPLARASVEGLLFIVQHLTQQSVDVNFLPDRSDTALLAAAAQGHQSIVQLLLDLGADVNARGWSGTALQKASEVGHEPIVRLLLLAGADVNAGDGLSEPALIRASIHGQDSIVQLLIDQGAADVNARGQNDRTALQLASLKGFGSTVQLLLEGGASVNERAESADSALHGACREGHLSVVRLLVERGANVNANGGYQTPLSNASGNGHDAIVKFLLDRGARINDSGYRGASALQVASGCGHLSTVRLLLEAGANINEQPDFSNTALTEAVEGSYEPIVELLLDWGADVDPPQRCLETTLQVAVHKGFLPLVKTLLERGAKVNANGGRYGTALQAAASKNHLAIAQLLLEHGADVNAWGNDDGTALQRASRYGYEVMVRLLLAGGANASCGDCGRTLLQEAYEDSDEDKVEILRDSDEEIAVQNGAYGTPLQMAAYEGHESIVKLLLESRAEVNAPGGLFGTALQTAAMSGHLAIVQLLISHNADVNVKGGYFGTAIHRAGREGHTLVVEALLAHGADISGSGGYYGRCRSLTRVSL